jgi:hypothetical protein
MRPFRSSARRCVLRGAAGLLLAGSAAGQGTGTARVPDDDELARYVRAFMAIGQMRDASQAELAQPKNKTREAQEQLREKLRADITRAVRDQGLSDARYQQITFVVSADTSLRRRFDEAVARASADKKPPPSDSR